VAVRDNALWGLRHQFRNLLKKRFGRLQVAMFTQPDIEQIAVLIDAAIKIAPLTLDSDVGFVHILDTTKGLLAFVADLLREFWGKALAPLAHRFVAKIKTAQPKKFGHIAIAELKAQATVEDLKDDIGRNLKVIERRARLLVETPLATPAKMQRIAQTGGLIQANSGIFRMTMGALHDGGSATMPSFID